METVNKLANAASTAIWGDQSSTGQGATKSGAAGQEPLSGKTGDVKSGEPYDKGNDGVPKPLSSDPLDNTLDDNTQANKTSAASSNPLSSDPLDNTLDNNQANKTFAPSSNPTANGGSDGVKSLVDPGASTQPDHNTSTTPKATDTTNSGSVLGAPANTSGTAAGNTLNPTTISTERPSVGTGAGAVGSQDRINTSSTSNLSNPKNVTTEHQGAGIDRAPDAAEVQRIRETTKLAEGGFGASSEAPRSSGDRGHEAPIGATPVGATTDARKTSGGSSSSDNSAKDGEKDTPGKRSLKDKIKAKLHKH